MLNPKPDRPICHDRAMNSNGKAQWICPVCLKTQAKSGESPGGIREGQKPPERQYEPPPCPDGAEECKLSSNGPKNWHCAKRRGGCGKTIPK